MRKEKRVARIFSEVTGKYHVCDNDLGYLDARGRAYDSRSQVIAMLRGDLQSYPAEAKTYTHYIQPSGRVKKI